MVKARQASARLELQFSNPRVAKAVQASLKPEELLPKAARCTANITRKRNVLCLEVDARDTAALRAALNSFLRWAIVARDVVGARE